VNEPNQGTEDKMKRLITAVFLIGLTANIFAQGRIIIPEFPERPAYNRHTLQLKSVDANISIRNGLADVQLQQTFLNPSQYRLEGEYIFPIPENSQIHDFQLYVDGEKLAGEVLKAEEARQIYYDIVRRLRDPALLEYSENNLFRARIFPVEAGQERQLQISYSQVLEYDGGSYRFVLPIRQSGEGTIEKFHVNIHLVTQSPAANIYSPSHQIDVSRENDRSAKISFEASHLQGEKDLVLYYSLASQAIGGAMLSFRPRTDQDGYFVFMAEPVFETAQAPQLAKDVIFVIDVSGSMQGKKMEQAREALKFCVNALNPRDRFQIIHFSSVVNDFQNGLKYATEDAIGNADYFISNLSASGGTNINEALLRALRLKPQPDNRPTSIIFLTDGLPTEGETDIKKIISNIEEEGLNNIRIFNFGVGYDVNTFLLDKLAEIGHGTANYVKPGENI
jgi:Ca-activated chloride channel family protein